MILQLNLNEQVEVTLTDAGLEILRVHYKDNPYYIHEPEKRTRTFQLHELMHIFGKGMYVGSTTQAFKDNVFLVEV